MKILTYDSSGKPNGYVQPIWSALEAPELRPEQIYLTVIAPHARKGPHLHMTRRGLFVCIRGQVRVRWRDARGSFHDATLGDGDKVQGWIVIAPGTPCALYNDSDAEAFLLNLPSPAWSAADPDEHPVEGWVDE